MAQLSHLISIVCVLMEPSILKNLFWVLLERSLSSIRCSFRKKKHLGVSPGVSSEFHTRIPPTGISSKIHPEASRSLLEFLQRFLRFHQEFLLKIHKKVPSVILSGNSFGIVYRRFSKKKTLTSSTFRDRSRDL